MLAPNSASGTADRAVHAEDQRLIQTLLREWGVFEELPEVRPPHGSSCHLTCVTTTANVHTADAARLRR